MGKIFVERKSYKVKNKSCKLTPGRQEIIGNGSKRRKYRSIKEKGITVTVQFKLLL